MGLNPLRSKIQLRTYSNIFKTLALQLLTETWSHKQIQMYLDIDR